MKSLVEMIVRSLLDHPEEIRIEEHKEDDFVVMRLKLAQDDYGKVIGKGGNNIRAIRTIVKAAAYRQKKRIGVYIGEEKASRLIDSSIGRIMLSEWQEIVYFDANIYA